MAKDSSSIWIYHERQEALLCGQHALNNLAQSPVFTVSQLTEIAWELDQLEQSVLDPSEARQPSANVDPSGNFSIQVLKQALQEQYGIVLSHLSVMLGEAASEDVTDLQGFLCHKSSHWFAIRQVDGRFWNLNSTLERPALVSHFSIGTEVANWQNDGYNVYGIRAGLPQGGVKLGTSHRGGTWHRMSDLLRGKSTDTDPWESLTGKGIRLDGGTTYGTESHANGAVSLEEEELQRALQASMETAKAAQLQERWSMLVVPSEPVAGSKGSVRLQIKLPDGSRLVRRFQEDDPVEQLYAFVYQRNQQQHGGLELRYGFPPKDLSPQVSQTIGQAKLAGETIQGRYT